MASDLSRRIFNPENRYHGVIMQQGRVQLDSDWNEQLDIQLYRTQTQTKDVIGLCGVPKGNDGFKVESTGNALDFNITPGRIYVGGMLCESFAPITFKSQPFYFPKSEDIDPASGKIENGHYLVYIDVWQREINYLDAPLIKEVALLEADTTTRLQTVYQIKLMEVDTGTTCESLPDDWNNLISPPTGKLNVNTNTDSGDGDNPCLMPLGGGYTSLDNFLYKVEIHNEGSESEATFKWSRYNGSIEASVKEKLNDKKIVVDSLGKDEYMRFKKDNWVELIDDLSVERNSFKLLQISNSPSEDDMVIEFTEDIDILDADLDAGKKFKIRLWDQTGDLATDDGIPVNSSDWIKIENGIEVHFSEGTYHKDDYWLIPGREALKNVEWPPYDLNEQFDPQLPKGINHSYCKLALIHVEDDNITVTDCRPLFPTLTELYECCLYRGGKCEISPRPEPGWERIFDLIEDNMDAHICFGVGEYPLSQPVIIENKGNLKIEGCGPGSKIIAPNSEAALVFKNCTSVTIRDIYGETRNVGNVSRTETEHLNGTLTFLNCPEVNVDHVHLKCGAGVISGATCMTIRNLHDKPSQVRVLNSHFQIGYLQKGILIVNANWALVEGNVLSVYKKPKRLNFKKRMQYKRSRALVRNVLIAGEQSTKRGGQSNINISRGTGTVNFRTPPSLKREKVWELKLNEKVREENLSSKQLYGHLNEIADKLLYDEDYRRGTAFEAYFEKLSRQDPSVASQGIVVGGRVANDIRIVNNTMHNVLQGIHVGLSLGGVRSVHYHIKNLLIHGNTVHVLLPVTVGNRGRHGIFVGNCESVVIENNLVRLQRMGDADRIRIDGIRLWGLYKYRLLVCKNQVFGLDGKRKSFNTGIRVNPIAVRKDNYLWLVNSNVAPSIQSTVVSRNGVSVPANSNFPNR